VQFFFAQAKQVFGLKFDYIKRLFNCGIETISSQLARSNAAEVLADA